MSIPVPLDGLRAAVADRGDAAYVLTVSDDLRPHVVHATVGWDGDALVMEVGRRSAANAGARSAVSLLFPIREPGDYSLIVDGTARVLDAGEHRRLVLTPAKAVLHRPAATPDPSASCADDCVPVLAPRSRA